MRPRKLTDQQEDEFLTKYELRKTLGLKALCNEYAIARRTILDVLKRARARREASGLRTGT